jgi:hypothetical protein
MTSEKHQIAMSELASLLAIPNVGLRSFAHGQLKYAANFAVVNFGHFWAMKRPISKDPYDVRRLRFQIKKIVLESASGWHVNKDQVWSRFRKYAIEQGALIEAQSLVLRLDSGLNGNKLTP